MADTSKLEAKECECQTLRAELAELATERAGVQDLDYKPEIESQCEAEKDRLQATLARSEGEARMLSYEIQRDEAIRGKDVADAKTEAALAAAREQASWTKWLAVLALLAIVVSLVALFLK